MIVPDSERCVADVSEPPHYFHRHRCRNRATGERDGLKLCGIHRRAKHGIYVVTDPYTLHVWQQLTEPS